MAVIQASVSNAPIIQRNSYLDVLLGRLGTLGQLGGQVMQALAYQNQIKAQQQANWNTAFQKALTMDKPRGAVLLRGVGAPASVIEQYMAIPDAQYEPGLSHTERINAYNGRKQDSVPAANDPNRKVTTAPATAEALTTAPQGSLQQQNPFNVFPDYTPGQHSQQMGLPPTSNASSAVPAGSPLSQTQDALNFYAALTAPSIFGV